MPNVYQPLAIQVRPQWIAGGDPLQRTPENVLWFKGETPASFPLDPTDLAAIAAVFDAAYADLWKHVGSQEEEYGGSIITDWSSSTGLEQSSVGVFTPVAGLGTVRHSAATSVLTSLLSSIIPRYRGGHPRVYLPLIGSVMDSQYTFNGTDIAAVQSRWTTLNNNMEGVSSAHGGGFHHVIYRHRNDPVNAAMYEVQGYHVQSEAATQRRRLRKAAHT